jgi:GNAT superfamily N-acetyltransferase
MTIASLDYDATLARGGPVHVRRVRPTDRQALRELHAGLSSESVYQRFFTAGPNIERELDRLVRPSDACHETVVALMGDALVGVGGYEVIGGSVAEIFFLVGDDRHGLGLATLLLGVLASVAHEQGIEVFVADTLAHNAGMLSVFRDCGLPYVTHPDGATVSIRVPLDTAPALHDTPGPAAAVLRPPVIREHRMAC